VRASGSAEEAAAAIRRDYPALRLAQLLASPRPEVREAAAHSLGLVAEFGEVGLVVPALHDSDPAVHKAAEASCLRIFCRDGTAEDRHELALIIQRLQFGDPLDAVRRAGALIMRAPALAEAYNQRAIARYQLRQYLGSLQDCRRTLELNPHHFGAAIGMAQCYLAIDDRPAALEALELTERLNPDMAGVRAQIDVLRKLLNEAPASAERPPQRP
jgi:tetratricopeptide (TPR) repeat protein